jgi:transcription elongation factor GreA
MAKGEPIPMSAEGKAALETELRELVDERRPSIVQRMKTAREEGDLKENFGYHDARQELGMLDGRVQTIEATLRLAVVVDQVSADGAVSMGSKVMVKDDFGDSNYVIVGPTEADIASGKVSIKSPLGQALMGSKVGEKVGFETPGGKRSVEIVKVS